MEYTAETVDLPFLGPSLETMIRCEACGYRHTDFVLTQSHEPMRYSYAIAKADDMMVRVVRSATCTIRIPELGIHIEPGTVSEAFISNIEGIIVRVERVLGQLGKDVEDAETDQRIAELAAVLQAMREGKAPPATLIFDDPFGNSRILGEGATATPLSPEEASKLQVGMLVFDKEGRMIPQGPRDDDPIVKP
jgi:zinc finger protein